MLPNADTMQLADFIATRLRELRSQCGMTQEQVAARLGADPRWYQRLELSAKDMRVSTVDRLAEAFGLTAVEFLADEVPTVKVKPHIPTAPHKQKKAGGRKP